MSSNTPRRPSRTSTPRPRKIAGRDVPPAETDGGAGPADPPEPPERPVPGPPPPEEPDEPHESRLTSPRSTRVLLGVVGVLVLLVLAQGAWFYLHDRENDDRAAAASRSASADGGDAGTNPISVPSGRPVVLNQLAVQEGVDAAALAAQTMFARNWESYDQGVDDAVALMTEEFAEEYRATTDDVKREFVAKKTEVQVRVVAQSVVRANDTEVEALVFLNQYIFRGRGEDATNTYTPYRAVIMMVHTDQGWLVDGLQTK